MSSVEVRDVADGLWLWRQPHPAWEEGNDWVPEVASFAVRSGGVSLLLDPLAPHPREDERWDVGEASRFGQYAHRLWDGLLAAEVVSDQ